MTLESSAPYVVQLQTRGVGVGHVACDKSYIRTENLMRDKCSDVQAGMRSIHWALSYVKYA